MVDIILKAAMVIIVISLLIVLIRFLKGKTVLDRVVALDVMTISTTGLIVLLANFFERVIYIDVSIVYSILSFIGVIVIAKYMEKSL